MSHKFAISTGIYPPEPRPVESVSDLQGWADHAWTDGVQVDRLRDLDVLLVRTRNTLYDIRLVSAETGEAIVRGGRFFPEPARAVILGSSLGGAFLKLRGIYCGFCLELYSAGARIVTSSVQSVTQVPDRVPDAVQ